MNPEEVKRLKSKYFSTFKLLKKKKMPVKHARVGDSRVEYFRIQDLEEAVNNNLEDVKSLLQTDEPLKLLESQAYWHLARPLNAKKLKYPQVLEPSATPTQFGSFKFPTQESKRWLMILVVAAILFVVLFPVWPYEFKYYVWYISLILLVLSIGLIVLRLLLYSILSLFGYSFWLFPNLLIESSVIQSFKPFHSIHRWQKSTFTIILRLVILGVFIYYGYEIYRDPTFVFENFNQTKQAVKDLHDWGVSKIKNEKNFTQRALTGSLEKILNETQDAERNQTARNATTVTQNGQPEKEL